MQQNSSISLILQKIYRHKILIIVVALCLIVIALVSQYSFIQINTSSNSNNITFTLQNDETHVTGTFTNSVRRLVKKGSYQVTTHDKDGTFFSVANTQGFLQTTNINSKHRQEEVREYIGDKPGQCLYSDNGNSLISWQCGGGISSANFHVGPSNNSPGYSLPLAVDATEIKLLGFVLDSAQLKAFVSHKDEHGTDFGLYPVNTSTHKVTLDAFKKVEGLNQDKEYGVSTYQNGYLVYSTLGDEFLYYQNFSAPPQKLNIQPTKISGINFYGINTSNDSITILNNQHYNPEYLGYSFLNPSTAAVSDKYFEEEDEGSSPEDYPLNLSEVVLYSNNKEQRYSLNFAASQARLCGADKLCVVSDETLLIYEIRQDKLRQVGEIPNIKQIETSSNKVFAVTDEGLLTIDTNTLTGFYKYMFKDYIYCGLQLISSDKVLLCIERNNKSSILVVGSGQDNTIDSKIAELMDMQEVSTVSVYKNSILIVPKVSNTVFNQTLSSYTFDPKEIANKKAAIEAQIRKTKLNNNYYKIRYSVN